MKNLFFSLQVFLLVILSGCASHNTNKAIESSFKSDPNRGTLYVLWRSTAKIKGLEQMNVRPYIAHIFVNEKLAGTMIANSHAKLILPEGNSNIKIEVKPSATPWAKLFNAFDGVTDNVDDPGLQFVHTSAAGKESTISFTRAMGKATTKTDFCGLPTYPPTTTDLGCTDKYNKVVWEYKSEMSSGQNSEIIDTERAFVFNE